MLFIPIFTEHSNGNVGTLTAHVTNATLGVVDFLFSDTDPIQGKVQATQFAGKEIS